MIAGIHRNVKIRFEFKSADPIPIRADPGYDRSHDEFHVIGFLVGKYIYQRFPFFGLGRRM